LYLLNFYDTYRKYYLIILFITIFVIIRRKQMLLLIIKIRFIYNYYKIDNLYYCIELIILSIDNKIEKVI
jgi:hypothetical protein